MKSITHRPRTKVPTSPKYIWYVRAVASDSSSPYPTHLILCNSLKIGWPYHMRAILTSPKSPKTTRLKILQIAAQEVKDRGLGVRWHQQDGRIPFQDSQDASPHQFQLKL